MPPAPVRRQPDPPVDAWFRRDRSLRLIAEVQRQVVPELTRVFGHSGLYLRPTAAIAPSLSGNMLAGVLSLYRDGDGLGGDLRCGDEALPIADASLALVYALFVFETSPAPEALLAEIARVLKPEGVGLFVGLNPWSLLRLRWAGHGLTSAAPGSFATQVRDAGLEVQRRRFVGPLWSPPDRLDLTARPHDGPQARLRMAHLTVARRRDPGLTPLRAGPAVVGFRPGISTG
jgi:SAM-dependent methyltransferase